MTRKLDGLLAAVGVLFGAASLAWPFGWDTSVHYYVGREWLLRGSIPYRDTFDHKTPGIHLVHALAIAVFGEGMWGIRVIELASVVLLGWACAGIARDRTTRAPPGLTGATILAASVYYYGFYDYWNTAQCELLGTTCAALMLLAAVRPRSLIRAGVGVGLFAGLALVLKPPFALFVLVAVPVLIVRARGAGAARLVRPIAALVAAAVAVPGVVLVYFAAHGALHDLVEIVVYANAAYVENEQRLSTVGEIVDNAIIVWKGYAPVAALVFAASGGAIVFACVRRSARSVGRWALAAGMLGVGYAVIVLQLKFYYYHWITELSAGTLMTANVLVELSRLQPRRAAWATVLGAAAVLGAFALTGPQASGWLRTTVAAVRWLDGDEDRARFASTFQTWDGVRRYGELEATGLWIRERSAPGDELLVRGVAAEVYVVSRLHAPGRFFWTAFSFYAPLATLSPRGLAGRGLGGRRLPASALGRDVDGRRRRASSPRSYFLPRGYIERTRIGGYSVLERTRQPSP